MEGVVGYKYGNGSLFPVQYLILPSYYYYYNYYYYCELLSL